MFKKSMDFGQAGDNVGVLLRGIKRDDVRRGQVLAAPNTIKTYRKFKAEVYVLKQNEGGRHTPFFNKYRCAKLSSRRCSRHEHVKLQTMESHYLTFDVKLFLMHFVSVNILSYYHFSILALLTPVPSFVCAARPQFFFRTADVTGDCTLPEGVEMVNE